MINVIYVNVKLPSVNYLHEYPIKIEYFLEWQCEKMNL